MDAAGILFMLGYALLVRGLIDILFAYNVGFISRRIGRGQLDHMLIQPQPIWMALLTEGFTPFSGSGMLLPGLGLLLLGRARPAGRCAHARPGWRCWCSTWSASAAVVLAFNYCWGSLAFWAPRAAEEINSSTIAADAASSSRSRSTGSARRWPAAC